MSYRFVMMWFCIGICACSALGDTLHLKDGTILEGRVYDQGDSYFVKDNNGDTHVIDKSTVDSWTKTAPLPSPAAAPSFSRPTVAAGSSSFAGTKIKAEASDTAIAAVGIWQNFIDAKPSPSDLAAAKVELKHWQEVLDTGGEKINGKWVWGEEHEKLIKQVVKLIVEGDQAIASDQTLLGISKFEEATRLYPNNFEANFELGYFNLVKGVDGGRNNAKIDAGIKSLEIAAKLRPDIAAAWSDLAIGYSFRQKYLLSVQTAYKAAKLEDTKEIVTNLIGTIGWAPPGMQSNPKVKPIVEETLLLAAKYGLLPTEKKFVWVRPERKQKRGPGLPSEEEEKDGPPGIFGEGTGFFVSDDGYILTNRHVAKPGDYLMVRMKDGTTKLAQRIIIDDEQDMAVLKIKVSDKVPFVRLAAYDHPPVGADVAVFGFPLLDRFGLKSSVKMTRGIVTAVDKDNELCDVTVDAIVNPGNSGGPMVDHHGNLLALTAMKTVSTDGTVSTYGLGYSTERVRKFFSKQQSKLAAAHLIDGKDDGPILTNEDLATRLTPATVCILVCRGTPPGEKMP